jgi:hypothetical protein
MGSNRQLIIEEYNKTHQIIRSLDHENAEEWKGKFASKLKGFGCRWSKNIKGRGVPGWTFPKENIEQLCEKMEPFLIPLGEEGSERDEPVAEEDAPEREESPPPQRQPKERKKQKPSSQDESKDAEDFLEELMRKPSERSGVDSRSGGSRRPRRTPRIEDDPIHSDDEDTVSLSRRVRSLTERLEAVELRNQ